MGYNIQILNSNVVLLRKNEREAYRRMCELNKRDDLKHGGSFAGGKTIQSWFSWMDPHYDKKCKTAIAIFDMLGFDSEDIDGNIHVRYYNSKTGQEELFFQAIDDLLDGEIVWLGEDGAQWAWKFTPGKKMKVGHAKVTYAY